jgi:D-alanyl-D-alanine carboxypeptidase (penicillin-binding protein 5/6)
LSKKLLQRIFFIKYKINLHTNKLVHFYEGADGLKTGHTDDAGYCLAATVKRNGLRLIGIVLGEKDASTRNAEMMELLDYGFNTIKLNKLKSKGDVLKEIEVDKGTKRIIELVLKDDLNVIEENGSKKRKYDFDYEISNFSLPLKKGDCIGKVIVSYNGDVMKGQALCVKDDVFKLSYLKLFWSEFIDLICGII